MEWTDEGVVLGLRRHGETGVILEAMTRTHGRHLGLVRGGRSRAMQPVLQPGNTLRLVWRARLDEHLGGFVVEPLALRTDRVMASRLALAALSHLTLLLRLLPERDPHDRLYEALGLILEKLDDPGLAPALIARFELALLDELGFGLDLARCAATGATFDLAYVSPRTGRAVSRSAGEPWRDRLLSLPAFLRDATAPTGADIVDAYRLTGYFLDRDVFGPRGIMPSDGRAALIAAARQALAMPS